mgnify:CR=1 FL=1
MERHQRTRLGNPRHPTQQSSSDLRKCRASNIGSHCGAHQFQISECKQIKWNPQTNDLNGCQAYCKCAPKRQWVHSQHLLSKQSERASTRISSYEVSEDWSAHIDRASMTCSERGIARHLAAATELVCIAASSCPIQRLNKTSGSSNQSALL